MIQAMIAHLGIISHACTDAGINRATHYKWLKSDAKYAETIKDIEEAAIDVAESALLKEIKAGSIAAIIFYLKTKGKKRGYVERTENRNVDENGNDVAPVKQVFTINGKDIEFS